MPPKGKKGEMPQSDTRMSSQLEQMQGQHAKDVLLIAALEHRVATLTARAEAAEETQRSANREWQRIYDELGADRAQTRKELEQSLRAHGAVCADLATAQARVAELEKKCADDRAWCGEMARLNYLRGQERVAAESALASANARLEADGKVCTAVCREVLQLRAARDRALRYLTDKWDIESTPLHAIGHAVRELRAGIPSATPEPPALTEAREADPESHPCNPDVEPCGCEQSVELQREVERLQRLTEDRHAPNTLEWRKMVDGQRAVIARARVELERGHMCDAMKAAHRALQSEFA